MADADCTAPTSEYQPNPQAPKTPRARQRKRVAQGIRRDSMGYEAYVRCGKVGKAKRFKLTTSLTEIRRWRERTRLALADGLRSDGTETPDNSIQQRWQAVSNPLEKSLSGWCYVYVIQDGNTVKIGRTMNPAVRLSELQTAHHRSLKLVCAVPTHASFEAAVHKRFAHLALSGEWFTLNHELIAFIDSLCTGQNPVALLW